MKADPLYTIDDYIAELHQEQKDNKARLENLKDMRYISTNTKLQEIELLVEIQVIKNVLQKLENEVIFE